MADAHEAAGTSNWERLAEYLRRKAHGGECYVKTKFIADEYWPTPPGEPILEGGEEVETQTQIAGGKQPSGPDHLTETREGVPATSPELPLDTLLEVAQNKRRRRILQYLPADDGAVEIGELAEYLARLEYDCPDAGPTSTQRKRMYVGIYQGHLPKMDDLGIVEFDEERGRVEPGPNVRQATRFVERVTGDDPPWPYIYLALASLAGGLFVVPFVWPASPIAADLGLSLVLGVLVLVAGGHLYWTRRKTVSNGVDEESQSTDGQ